MKIIDQKQIKYKYGKFYVSTINEDGGYADLHYEIYASLSDVTSPSNKVLYLIGPTGSGEDIYDEYIYSGTEFVKIGDTSIDLSNIHDTFIVEYGVTDFMDIVDAAEAGKTLVAINTGNNDYSVYYVNEMTADGVSSSFMFTSFSDDNHRFDFMVDAYGYSQITETLLQTALTFDSTPTTNSYNPVTSGGVKTAIDALKTAFTLIDNSSGAAAESSCNVELGKVYAFTDALDTYTINLPAITDSSTTPATYTAPDVITLYIETGASPNISIIADSLTETIYQNSGFEFEANTLLEVSLSNANGKWYLAGIEMEEVV